MAYAKLVDSGKEQPQSTHGDRYDENRSYSISSYVKGSIFLSQLGYLIGEEKLKETLHRYYADFKFKHPTPNDVKRSSERVSGANLDMGDAKKHEESDSRGKYANVRRGEEWC